MALALSVYKQTGHRINLTTSDMDFQARQIKTVIFDMDGTLLDSMALWTNLVSRYLTYKGISPSQNLPAFPMGAHSAVKFLQTHCGIADESNAILHDIHEIIRLFYHSEATIKRGVIELLTELKSRGMRMLLATATDIEFSKPVLQRFDIWHFFDKVYTAADLKCGKGNPEFFGKLLAKENLPASETILVEDALYSILTAKQVGLWTAAIYDDSAKSEWDAIVSNADVVLEDILDLVKFIDKN